MANWVPWADSRHSLRSQNDLANTSKAAIQTHESRQIDSDDREEPNAHIGFSYCERSWFRPEAAKKMGDLELSLAERVGAQMASAVHLAN